FPALLGLLPGAAAWRGFRLPVPHPTAGALRTAARALAGGAHPLRHSLERPRPGEQVPRVPLDLVGQLQQLLARGAGGGAPAGRAASAPSRTALAARPPPGSGLVGGPGSPPVAGRAPLGSGAAPRTARLAGARASTLRHGPPFLPPGRT